MAIPRRSSGETSGLPAFHLVPQLSVHQLYHVKCILDDASELPHSIYQFYHRPSQTQIDNLYRSQIIINCSVLS
jgi:hypothetical protein